MILLADGLGRAEFWEALAAVFTLLILVLGGLGRLVFIAGGLTRDFKAIHPRIEAIEEAQDRHTKRIGVLETSHATLAAIVTERTDRHRTQ